MIPARIEQFLKTLPEPDFFIGKNRTMADEIHDLLRQYVEQGTATIEVTVDVDLLLKVENVLRGYGWAAEEAMVLFYMWCIVCPDRLSTWCSEKRMVISDDLHHRRYSQGCPLSGGVGAAVPDYERTDH